ncbi:MAG: LD-carboxypeptidase [Ruminococcus sp.]|nr:LD-carboxypeptidase [Ruminococcus sp.]MBQ9808006.1 LD-carboxypeptidase [Ruminococcus sp.]
MIPQKLNYGDEIRIIAPSSSLTRVRSDIFESALAFLQEQGFNVTFSKNCRETNMFLSSSVRSRVDDIHEAFADKNVKAVMACIGGFNANEILPYLDYELIKSNPKILCGYSDITALLNGVYAKTGLLTYHAPHLAALGFLNEREYTQKYFSECMMSDGSFAVTPSVASQSYTVIQKGKCEGEIIGGNLCTLNLLQGTPYMPDIKNKILFLEDDNIMGDYFVCEFDRNLQSLLQVSGAETIRGIVFGRFDESCKMTEDIVKAIVKDKVSPDIPIVFGVDFGHVFPMFSFPIGGRARLSVNNSIDLKIIES